MLDVVALGDVNVDVIARFPSYPAEGEDAFALSSETRCGGSAANSARALCRLGLHAGLIGRVGRDPWGELALDSLRESGVTVSGLQVDPEVMTGLIYIVVTPDGARTMLSYRGANVRTDPAQVEERDVCNARLLHLSGYALLAEPQRSAALRALELARRCGLIVTLDPGSAPATLEVMQELLPQISILLPTLAEARALARRTDPEECAEVLLSRGAGTVAIKLGQEGCLVARREHLFRVPAFPVEAVDTTGAGDAFDAGIIAAHLGGLGWHSAALLANALGALTATQMGACTEAQEARKVACLLQTCRDSAAWHQHAQAADDAIAFLRLISEIRG